MNKKLIILDRDGCINKSNQIEKYIFEPDKFEVYSDVFEMFNSPKANNFNFAVATNQQGIGKNLYSIDDVLNLHNSFLNQIGKQLEEIPIFICPHLQSDPLCNCRQPKAGLLINALNPFQTNAKDALFVGNQLSDAKAAEAAGINFFYLNRFSEANQEIPIDLVYSSDSDLGAQILEDWF